MDAKPAVIFDFDGVLFDTDTLHAQSWLKTFQAGGLSVTYQDCLPAIKMEDHHFAQQIFTGLGLTEQPAEWVRRKQDVYRDMFRQKLRIFPGAAALVERLAGRYPLAIVSSTWRENQELATTAAGIREFFQFFVGKEDVTSYKPDPEGYLTAARLLRTTPAHCFVFEDSPRGIAAAKAAGMKCCGVAHKRDVKELAAADLVVPNLLDTDRLVQLVDNELFKG